MDHITIPTENKDKNIFINYEESKKIDINSISNENINMKNNDENQEKIEIKSISDKEEIISDQKEEKNLTKIENEDSDKKIDYNQNFINNNNKNNDSSLDNNDSNSNDNSHNLINNNNKSEIKEEKNLSEQKEENKSSDDDNSIKNDNLNNSNKINNIIKRKESQSSSEENNINKSKEEEENKKIKEKDDNNDFIKDYVNINLNISDKNNIQIENKISDNSNIKEININDNNNNINNDFVHIDLVEDFKEVKLDKNNNQNNQTNQNIYPDLEKKSSSDKNTNNNFSFEILGEDEHEKLKILSGKNISKDLSNFDPSEDIVSNSSKNVIYKNLFDSDNKINNIREIMNLYNLLLEDDKEGLKTREYFIVEEKEEIKDLLGTHKMYEISFINSANVKSIKCYRRFKHFQLLNEKLKKTYPYIIIPKLPPNKNLSKMISPDKIFEDDRKAQLNFYINFLFLHENLKKTKEFIKFIETSKFDVAFYENNNSNQIMTQNIHVDLDLSGMNINYLDEITSKNKNYSLSGSLSSIWNFFIPYYSTNNKKREINDSEIIIRKMNIHFNNIINQYTLISENIEKIFKANEDESSANKKISDVFLFLKDSFIHLNNYDKIMQSYYEQTKILSERQIESVKKASKLKHKLTALINLLCGICFTLEKYLNFIDKYNALSNKMNKMKSQGNKGKNYDDVIKQYQIYERVKNKFELQLSKETNIYCQIYDETTYHCLLKFREVLESSTIVKIINKENNNNSSKNINGKDISDKK